MRINMLFLLFLCLTLSSCNKLSYEDNSKQKEETTVAPSTADGEVSPPPETPLSQEETYIPNSSGMVEKGNKVAVHYTGTLENGTKFDSSLDRGQPLEFKAGAGQMIPGFDAGIIGMKVGEKKKLTLAPTDAYGVYDEAKKQVVPRADLKSFEAAGFKLEVGEKLPTQFGNLSIVSIDNTNITLDLNHELAGKTLIFDIELIEIKK